MDNHSTIIEIAGVKLEVDASLRAENALLREALRYYARPEHWMALTDAADSPRVVWVARTHLDASADGCSTAFQVLMSLVPPPTQAEIDAALALARGAAQ